MSDFECLFALGISYIGYKKMQKKKEKRRKKVVWVKPWLANREFKSAYCNTLAELRLHDEEEFRRYLRINTEAYTELIEKVRPVITDKTTFMRKPISAEEKLAVTLRFLATGETSSSLMYQYRIHRITISKFIPEVSNAIYDALSPEYMRVPSSENEWLEIMKRTNERWQFPNSYAAADGKHVGIICPKHAGSEYYN